MSSLTNEQQKLAQKILNKYMDFHASMLKHSTWNAQKKNQHMPEFLQWVMNYVKTARNPTNKNIHRAYFNRYR